ncbi:hypothetical protein SLEP1_g56393 [Rubroshorea leprosula]|uniref:Uncharacterized protein n=1 Tax=Rubroshorea leprosula TaxID=152421 RepID=A0AAV5MJI1_9ROSI|nr:hypothetical protein SLEP1_g56393 [Rubroshorea leprosula]
MSSEEARSVVGSEVMPLEYGSMDTESSPSPTSSERTVEERREEVVVEEEEGRSPQMCSRSSLRGLVGNCNLPHHVLIRPAGVNERACSAPRDHLMPIYLHYLIVGLRFPIPELLVGLLLDYSIGITQLTPNAMRAGGRGEKGWYHFGPRSSSKGNRNLFSPGPSSIKGWKENFFFVDDTEWSRRDSEVEQLSAWKAKKTKQNNYKLNEDEVEEVKKLVREDGDVVDILFLTSSEAIDAAELYGPSSLGEVRHCCWGLRIPKKPRKKSKTSTAAEKEVTEGGRLLSISAQAMEVQPRPEPMMGGSEDVSEEMAPLQRKKRRVAELGTKGDEVVEFVPLPSPPEINPEDRERGEVEVRGLGGGRECTPLHFYQKSLFEATNKTGAKHFLNATLPEVDRVQAKNEVVSHAGYTVVRHALESASWTNALAQEYAESVRDCASLQRQCDQLQKEKDELQKEKGVWEKEKREMQRRLDEVLPSVTELQNENDVLSTKLVLEERKRKICEERLEAQGSGQIHGQHEERSSGAEEECEPAGSQRDGGARWQLSQLQHKVKAQYPEVDVTTVTFGEQEEGVEEDGESLCADFRPQIPLRWERDAEGCTIFPPAFDAELVAVEGEEEEEEEEGAQGTGVEGPAAMAEVQPPEVHPVSSDELYL